MSNYVGAFIKFVKEIEHAKDFLDGNLYCNPWILFEGLEDEQRGDKVETAASIRNKLIYNPLTCTYVPYSLILKDKDDFFTPVFCLYSVFSKKYCFPHRLRLQNDKLRGFGKYGVVIRDVEEFIKRLEIDLPGFSYGLIEYLDFNNLTGKNKFALTNPII